MKQASTPAITEEYLNILRGAVSHPVGRLKYIDDAGAEQTIAQDVMDITIRLDRDDQRESDALLIPPASTLTVTFSNVDKQFVTGFGGIFDGIITRGRRFIPELGHKVSGTSEFFQQGIFISDDPSFNVNPSATVRITSRDFLGILVDNKVSLVTESSIKAEAYIVKILERVGLTSAEYNIQVTATTLLNTPTIEDENAAELISEVMEYLQLEDDWRLVSKDNKITLEVPNSDVLAADYVYHWINHIAPPYTRMDDTVKMLKRLTVSAAKPSVSAGLAQGTQSGKTEADLPFVHSFTNGPAIHTVWQQGSGDTVEIVETARTTSAITLNLRNPGDTGTWSLTVFGDKITSGSAGEAAEGENIRLNRGKTVDIVNRFVQDAAEAKSLADSLGTTRIPERVRAEFTIGHGWLLGEINDLVRMVEKYSNDKRLYHLVQMTHRLTTKPARLDTKIIAEFAGLTELAQLYDSGFKYDTGRIYDERFDVGAFDQEDTSFRGAVITKN